MGNCIISTLSVIILTLAMIMCQEWTFIGMIWSVYIIAGYSGYSYAESKARKECAK